jgi:hypothetical protein
VLYPFSSGSFVDDGLDVGNLDFKDLLAGWVIILWTVVIVAAIYTGELAILYAISPAILLVLGAYYGWRGVTRNNDNDRPPSN